MEIIKFTIFLPFQIAALIAAIWYWNAYKHTTQRYFLAFLIYVVVHEVLGLFYQVFLTGYNDILHNVFTLISFLFYFNWLHKILKERKWIIYILTAIFIIVYSYDAIQLDPWNNLYLTPIIVGGISILILTISYFVELIREDRVVSFQKSQRFWIVAGLLFFYIGLIPLLLFHKYLDYSSFNYGFVIDTLNIVLYTCFIKSFLCLKD